MDLPHILITGKADHGKSTVGEYLVARYGYTRTGFADPLKQEVAQAYRGVTPVVTPAFLDERRHKDTPVAHLALKNCTDREFVRIVLPVLAHEDFALFRTMQTAFKEGSLHGPATRYAAAARRALGFDTDPAVIDTVAANAAETARMLLLNPLALGPRTAARIFSSANFLDSERLQLPRSPRRLLQPWGTEYRRAQDPRYWINITERFLDECEKTGGRVVLTDGRFHQECDWGEDNGLLRLHVERPGHGTLSVKHVSENVPPPTASTIVLINDRLDDGLASLHQQIDHALLQILESRPRLQRMRA